MTSLRLLNLHKSFSTAQGKIPVLDGLDLEVNAGEMLALLGPSGCGKSTLLRLVAGLLLPDSGDIHFDGQSILNIPPEKRGAVIVFQENQLFPFMTVAENIAFGLKIKKRGRADIRRRVAEVLELVQLDGCESRYPEQLSGGQRQRVALARAVAISPRVLLLDEPLNNLDASLRLELRHEIMRLQKQLGITAIFVTHDQNEAVMVADRIALLMDGGIIQAGDPRDFYERPASAQVARFFGAANILPAYKDGNTIRLGDCCLQVQDSALADGKVWAMIRPEAVQLGANGANTLRGSVCEWLYQGEHSRGTVRCGELDLYISSPPYVHFQAGDTLEVHIAREHIWLMPFIEENS